MNEQDDKQPIARAVVLERAWQLLQDGQPRMAKQIAAELVKGGLAGVDRSLVNSVLAREGKGTFVYDQASYTYSLVDGADAPAVPEGADDGDGPLESGPAVARSAVLETTRDLLSDGEPRRARQIAAELVKRGLAGVDKSLVNSVLAREGKGIVEYDRESFTYRLAGGEGAGGREQGAGTGDD